MALHTDDDHPHVHVLLKALGEDGMRLNVRKATLRSWRAQFAENLRQLGVAANATERTVRGQVLASKRDRICRAAKRGESTYGAAQERRAVGNRGGNGAHLPFAWKRCSAPVQPSSRAGSKPPPT